MGGPNAQKLKYILFPETFEIIQGVGCFDTKLPFYLKN